MISGEILHFGLTFVGLYVIIIPIEQRMEVIALVERENILTYFLNAIKTELHDDNSSYNIANRLSQNIVQTMQLVRRKNYNTDGFMVWGMSAFVRDNEKIVLKRCIITLIFCERRKHMTPDLLYIISFVLCV